MRHEITGTAEQHAGSGTGTGTTRLPCIHHIRILPGHRSGTADKTHKNSGVPGVL